MIFSFISKCSLTYLRNNQLSIARDLLGTNKGSATENAPIFVPRNLFPNCLVRGENEKNSSSSEDNLRNPMSSRGSYLDPGHSFYVKIFEFHLMAQSL